MRELKFRAWSTIEDTWVDSDEIPMTGEPQPTLELFGNNYLVLMQYTGLKDKNGKEIYEGDIIQDKRIVFATMPAIIETLVVSFRQDGFYALNPTNDDPYPAFGKLRYYQGFEIIGNIYENPELIKQEVK